MGDQDIRNESRLTMTRTVFLDTETTGLSHAHDRLVEIAIIDENGDVLLSQLVNPGRGIPDGARSVHGISDAMVASAPTLESLWPRVRSIVSGAHIVMYNAEFDAGFFPDGLRCAAKITCAMKEFARIHGQWNSHHNDWKWQKLTMAAAHVGHRWEGNAHRALADALATRSVWLWIARQAKSSTPLPVSTRPPISADALCPQCGSPMRLRTAGRGPNAGNQFLGCSRFPDCRGRRPVVSGAAPAAGDAVPVRPGPAGGKTRSHTRPNAVPEAPRPDDAGQGTGIPAWVWVAVAILGLVFLLALY